MEYRKLKVNVISAQCLNNNALDCQVSVVGYPKPNQKTNPNLTEFVVDEPYLTKPGLVLLFQLKKQGSRKEVGSVSVPVEQLFQGNPSPTQERILEYQEAKGLLKFAYSFDEKQVETNRHPVEPTKHAAEPATYVHQAKTKKMMFLILFVVWAIGLVLGYRLGYDGGYKYGYQAMWKGFFPRSRVFKLFFSSP